jgi:hypothetical protein
MKLERWASYATSVFIGTNIRDFCFSVVSLENRASLEAINSIQ